ncbi:MAG: hypothetical protein ABFD00_05015, partial [Chloroherpetonaceae bacterium]
DIEKDRYIIKAYDIPYVNLYFHKDTCYKEIKERLIEYIDENSNRVFNLAGISNKNEPTKNVSTKDKPSKIKRKLGR